MNHYAPRGVTPVTVVRPAQATRNTPPFKRLSDGELYEEKFGPGHRCRNKELQVLVVQDGEEEEAPDAGREVEREAEVGDFVELSINSVVGFTTPKTMKLKGTVLGHSVVVLIDCGATHNFISEDLVNRLGLATAGTSHYSVFMGTGMVVRGGEVCKVVVVSLPKIDVVDDFLPLTLRCTDIILVME